MDGYPHPVHTALSQLIRSLCRPIQCLYEAIMHLHLSRFFSCVFDSSRILIPCSASVPFISIANLGASMGLSFFGHMTYAMKELHLVPKLPRVILLTGSKLGKIDQRLLFSSPADPAADDITAPNDTPRAN